MITILLVHDDKPCMENIKKSVAEHVTEGIYFVLSRDKAKYSKIRISGPYGGNFFENCIPPEMKRWSFRKLAFNQLRKHEKY